MHYVEVAASPAIRTFVECLWALDGPAPGAVLDPVFPDGHPELIVHGGDRFAAVGADGTLAVQGPVLLAGQMRHALTLSPLGHAHVVGARLGPHGLAAIFRGPAAELTDRVVDLDAIDPRLARHLFADVASRRTAEERLHALDRALGRWASVERIDPIVSVACGIALASRGLTRVALLARTTGLSARQFERRFGAQVGLSPKAFLRVVRFQQVLRAVDAGPTPDWARLAVELGFYDQPHFVNDFKAFTGHAPTDWNVPDGSLTALFSVGRRATPLPSDVAFFQDAATCDPLA